MSSLPLRQTALCVCLLLAPAWGDLAATLPGDEMRVLAARVSAAVDSNPAVLAAAAAVEVARAEGRAAGQPLYNPELAVDAEDGEVFTGSVGVSQAIDWSGKREARSGVQQYNLKAALADLAAVRQRVAAELLVALADAQTARAVADLATRRTALMGRFATLAERRFAAGDIGQDERDLARLSLAQAQLQESEARSREVDAQEGLTAVTGGETTEWPLLAGHLPGTPPAHPDWEGILDKLPVLEVHRARELAARAGVRVAERQQRPDPTVGVRFGRDGTSPLAGLSVSVPLYVRNTFRAQVQAASAQSLQEARTLQEATRRATARLKAAAQRYHLAADAWRRWQRSGEGSLEDRVSLLQRLWQAGELGTTDYLVQLKQTIDTRVAAAELKGRQWRAWAQWLAASGGIGGWLPRDAMEVRP